MSSREFRKYSNMRFYENPSSGSREVPCGRTDGQTDMTNLTVTFRNFAIAPKMNHSRITQTVLFSLTIADHKDVIG